MWTTILCVFSFIAGFLTYKFIFSHFDNKFGYLECMTNVMKYTSVNPIQLVNIMRKRPDIYGSI